VTRSRRAAGSAPSAFSVPTVGVRSVASRHARGRAAAIVILAVAAMVGLLVARPGGVLAAGPSPAHPIVAVASTVRAPAIAPTRIELPRSVPASVPKVRPGHDTTHLVRGVPLPPGWLAEAVGLTLLVLIGLVSLVEPVEPMAVARSAARGRGPPVRR
jgi:hypothetical protein